MAYDRSQWNLAVQRARRIRDLKKEIADAESIDEMKIRLTKEESAYLNLDSDLRRDAETYIRLQLEGLIPEPPMDRVRTTLDQLDSVFSRS